MDNLEAFYLEQQPRLQRIAMRYLRNWQDAEDILQDAFICISQKPPSLEDPRRAVRFISQVVRNLCIDSYRQSHKRIPHVHLEEGSLVDPSLNPEEYLSYSRFAGAIDDAFEQINSRRSSALLQIIHLGLKKEELGKKLGITTSAAGVLINRARKDLRKVLNPYFEEL